ncbi:hypothetical protein B0T25DRAFT_258503 [Lasiosphaeria hispida]|uniref:Uncharacterized protein n=1 Tax=Lasiosphaeria hispida TaxID=260671 RepID=A0AAJ0MD12_9PEZI|nr:hypothetical protein B0T25DRAFT_258503 [Lasiosphaeria hispida]
MTLRHVIRRRLALVGPCGWVGCVPINQSINAGTEIECASCAWMLLAVSCYHCRCSDLKVLQESRVPRKQAAPVAQSDEKYADTHTYTHAVYPTTFTPDFTFSLRRPLLFTRGTDGPPSS